MPRTQNCNLCRQAGVYFKTGPNGKTLLWDTTTGNWHHRSCPKLTDYRRSEFERLAVEFAGAVGAERTSKPQSESDDHSGLNESQVRNLIAETRPSLVSAAVREAHDTARDMVAELARRAVDKNELARIREFGSDLADTVTELLAKNQTLREQVERIAATVTSQQAQTQTIEVKLPNGTVRTIGRQHKAFADVLTYASLRKNVFMVGPAGSGKSTAAEKVAEALDLPFSVQPMGPAMTDIRFLGYQDANGKLVRTAFRERYENGGVFMADEMDKCHPGTLTAINGALANGVCGFPDGNIARHPDFIFLAGANTWGHGATSQYIGSTKLDGATLDRFWNVPYDYDEDFERDLTGRDKIGTEWVSFVQRVRAIVFTHKLPVIVSPRTSIEGADALRHGVPREKVENNRLWANMPADVRDQIRANL